MTYILVGAVLVLLIFMIIFGKTGISETNRFPTYIFWKLIYSDMYTEKKNGNITCGKILVSEKYGLKGKPDMIYSHRLTKQLLPVEIKSGKTDWPHRGDLLQVGTYMLIIEDLYGNRPKKAVICYKNTSFVVRNTKKLRREVLSVAERMRDMLITGDEEVKPSFVNCRHCICNGTVCEFCD